MGLFLADGRAGAFRRLGTVVIAALAIERIKSWTLGTLAAADATAKTADKVGLATDALQELHFAAERAGVGQNNLDMAMQRFSRRVGEAAEGGGELKGVLDQYNIAV